MADHDCTTLPSSLAATAQRRADFPALLFDESTFSYGDIHAAAQHLASKLIAIGAQPGERVVVSLGNSRELVVCVLATLACGATLVPVNPAATNDELQYLVNDSSPRVALAEMNHVKILDAAGLPNLQVLDGSSLARESFAEMRKPATEISPDIDADSPALIIYTSGTTGRPKGAVLSHRALITNLLTVANAWHWNANDRLLLTLPCFHLHGLGLGILTSLLVGSSVVLKHRFIVDDIPRDLQRHRCTMFFGVPTMYNRLVSLPDSMLEGHDLSGVRLWVSGSAPLNAATFERFNQRFGYKLMDRYGMTECCFALSTPYDEPRRPGVVGRALPGVEVRIVDSEAADAGRVLDVANGTQGEILISGPGLFSGYWQRPADTKRAMLDRYLRSGDIAVREPDGMVRICGRSSVDIIKTRGFKVSAVEVEEALQRHPAVEEVAVVGLADSDQGERVVAAVILRSGANAAVDELGEHAKRLLAPHKVPADIVLVDDIPRTGPGKFKKRELASQLCDRLHKP